MDFTPTQVRQARAFLTRVENRLGWSPLTPYSKKSLVTSVLKKIDTNPELYTWDNLRLAVELLALERECRSPLGVFAHVERAVKAARERESDIEILIREAVAQEMRRGDPHGWVTRFARATGWWRVEAYKEWRNEQARPA